MSVFYYGPGGGFGHLSRALAITATLHPERMVTVATNARLPEAAWIPDNVRLLAIPSRLENRADALGRWLERAARDRNATDLYVDVFPAGLFGEVAHIDVGWRLMTLVCRRVQWAAYATRVHEQLAGLLFARALIVEPLEPAHQTFVEQHAREIVPLDPRVPLPPPNWTRRWQPVFVHCGRPTWLVTHAGSHAECRDLLGFARDTARAAGVTPWYAVNTPHRRTWGNDCRPLSAYPVHGLFPLADRIVTACGFNAMLQTRPFAAKHLFLPLERRFDDQFWRAARRREQQCSNLEREQPHSPPAGDEPTPTPRLTSL